MMNKNLILATVGGFVAGVAVTLLVGSLCCGSHKMMHKGHFMHSRAAVMADAGRPAMHKGVKADKHHEMKKHGKHAKKDGAFDKRGFEKKRHHDKDFADNGRKFGKKRHDKGGDFDGKKFGKKGEFKKDGVRKAHLEPSLEMKAAFAEKLNLTDAQKAEIEKYRQEDMAKMKGLFDELERVRAEIKEARKAGRARFESVLTEEQKGVLENLKRK